MRTLIPFFVVLSAGCQTHAPMAQAPLPVAETVAHGDARIAERIGHYTLGAYVDPENNLIRHEAHAIQRVEAEARWDLRPAPLPPIITTATPSMALLEEAPASSLAASLIEPTSVASDSPDALPPVVSHSAHPGAQASAASDPAHPVRIARPVAPLEPAIVPNADGVIDLTAVATSPDGEINPFAVRAIGPESVREITLRMDGIINGPFPCVLVNGRTVQVGEAAEGLVLVRVEPDTALFRYDEHRIRIPVAGKPTLVRVAL